MTGAAGVDERHIDGVPYFNPDHYLINIVRRAKVNQQDVVISAGKLGDLLIMGGRREYFANCPDLSVLCRTPAGGLEVTVLAKNDRRLPDTNRTGRALDELKWEAAFHASEGRLLEGCSPVDVISLIHWPNLSRLSKGPNTIRLCALFTRHATSLIVAAKRLRVGLGELYQFYSAACCAGLTRPVNRPAGQAEEPNLQPYRDRTLLSRLFARISQF